MTTQTLFLAATLLLASILGYSQASASSNQTSPVRSPSLQQIADGQTQFNKTCTLCHGPNATGGEGPSLHGIALTKAQIESTIRTGIKGDMPSFAKKFDNAELDNLAAYVMSLKKQ